MTAPLLKIENLEVRYGDLIGVSDVSLDVPEGSVVALLGSNGGGKTTVLNAIAGLIPVHSGAITFRGEQIGGQTAFSIVRKGLALSPEGWRLRFATGTADAPFGKREGEALVTVEEGDIQAEAEEPLRFFRGLRMPGRIHAGSGKGIGVRLDHD